MPIIQHCWWCLFYVDLRRSFAQTSITFLICGALQVFQMLDVGAKSGKLCRIHLYTTVSEINYTIFVCYLIHSVLTWCEKLFSFFSLHLFIQCATFSLNILHAEI